MHRQHCARQHCPIPRAPRLSPASASHSLPQGFSLAAATHCGAGGTVECALLLLGHCDESVTWDIRRIEACIRSTTRFCRDTPLSVSFYLVRHGQVTEKLRGRKKGGGGQKLGSSAKPAKPLSPRTPPPLAPQTHHQTDAPLSSA